MVQLGERCTVGGQAGFAGHLEIANDVHIGGQGRVLKRHRACHYASGTGLMSTWTVPVMRSHETLNDMAKRIEALEKALAEEAKSNS